MVHPVTQDSAPAQARTTEQAGALIVGGDYRGLGVVRSLGRRGIPVWVLVSDHTLAAHSRYCARRLRWPRANGADKLGFLIQLGKQLQGWALYPTTDEMAVMISRGHADLSRYFVVTVPPWDKLQWAHDKRITYRVAQQQGLPVPATYYPGSREGVRALKCKFPVVVKPAITRGFNRFVHDKGWIANRPQELLALYDAACALVDPETVMVQEMIAGGGETQFSCAALCRDGTPLAVTVARRSRQYPLGLGRASTFVETVENGAVERQALDLLRAVRYTGLIELEFKLDSNGNAYRLLDANPRVWGWHSLCRRAGVDFPYLLWQMLHDRQVEPVRARPGVRWVRMVTDLQAVMRSMMRGSLGVKDYLRSFRPPLEFAIFAKDDLLPALLDVPLLAALALRRKSL